MGAETPPVYLRVSDHWVRSSVSAGLRTQGRRDCVSFLLPQALTYLFLSADSCPHPKDSAAHLGCGGGGAVRWRLSGQSLCCPWAVCFLFNPPVLWRGDETTALKFPPGAACWAQVTLPSGEGGVQAGGALGPSLLVGCGFFPGSSLWGETRLFWPCPDGVLFLVQHGKESLGVGVPEREDWEGPVSARQAGLLPETPPVPQ